MLVALCSVLFIVANGLHYLAKYWPVDIGYMEDMALVQPRPGASASNLTRSENGRPRLGKSKDS